MRVLVTRSLEDAEPLAAALGRRGHEAVLEPLMSITDVDVAAGGPDLDLDGAQALLITSAQLRGAVAGAILSLRPILASLPRKLCHVAQSKFFFLGGPSLPPLLRTHTEDV